MVNDTVIDPERPWIHNEHDDPKRADYIQVFLNPYGMTSSVIFTRGQILTWICRLPFILMALLGFAQGFMLGFFILAVISYISHLRRLQDASRAPAFALISLIPITLTALVVGLVLLAPDAPPRGEVGQTTIEKSEGNSNDSETQNAQAEDTASKTETSASSGRDDWSQGSPRTKSQNAATAGLFVWLIVSLPIMIWTFRWVATRPRKDEGVLDQGSYLVR